MSHALVPFLLKRFAGAALACGALAVSAGAAGLGSPTVNITATVTSASEGDALNLQIVLSQPATNTISVPLFFQGEGTAWQDFYINGANPVQIFAGQSSASVSLIFAEDAHFEGTETFDVYISWVVGNAVLGTQTQQSFTILDNDVLAQPGVQAGPHGSVAPGRVKSKLAASPALVGFDVLDEGDSQTIDLKLKNTTTAPLTITTLRFLNQVGSSADLSLVLGGSTYAGAASLTNYPVSVAVAGGGVLTVPVTFAPEQHGTNEIQLVFEGAYGALTVPVKATSGFAGDPYLHPVIVVDDVLVDYDGDGTASVLLDGSGSHTHEPGRSLVGWQWRENGNLLSSLEVATLPFGMGEHTVELTIVDDNVPAHTLAGSQGFQVVPVDHVPGVLALYYTPRAGQTIFTLLDNVPQNADFAEERETFDVQSQDGAIGGSALTSNAMVRMCGQVEVKAADTWTLTALGGQDRRLFFDGVPVTGPFSPPLGMHSLEVRYAVATLGDLPAQLTVQKSAGSPGLFASSDLSYNAAAEPPVMNSMAATGTTLGGNQIVIAGLGFFPQANVTVHWGAELLTSANFVSWAADRIEFLSPPGPAGTIDVTVESANGHSNALQFTYQSDGPVPINFAQVSQVTLTQPTAAAWGPDQRLYIVTRPGTLHAVTFGDDYSVQDVDVYPGVSGLSNHEAMGLAFNPYDGPSRLKVYIAHTQMLRAGRSLVHGPLALPGPGQPAAGTRLRHAGSRDHAVADVEPRPRHQRDGLRPRRRPVDLGRRQHERRRQASADRRPARVAADRRDRARAHQATRLQRRARLRRDAVGLTNNDQVFGEQVDLAPNAFIDVWASGLRNAFDLCLATNGYLYATDNGPNSGYGFKSTGATTDSGTHAVAIDELLLVERDHYYGHPNRNRGRYEQVQNVYFGTAAASGGGFTQALTTLSSSMNGLVEYRARAFGAQLTGDILTQKYQAQFARVDLGADGKTVLGVTTMNPVSAGLGVETGPGGALLVSYYSGNRLRVYVPSDLAAVGMTPYEITPWRGVTSTFFVIGGKNFGTLANTTVTIGGQVAALTSVSSTRIRGIVPPSPNSSTALVDVSVTSAGTTKLLPKAFRWLYGNPDPGVWETKASMPMPAGEVACGAIAGKLYLVGEGNNKTYAYDVAANTWVTTLATRPFVGHHHASEVVGNKWYLIGGLGAGQGKLQIYDPQTNQWTLGADLPWAGGSVSSAKIGGKIYASGGIVGSTTVDSTASYNPLTDSWTMLAPMAAGKGRNHAAAGSDGQRFYVFGGRGVGSGASNVVANGFDHVQIYNPTTNTWTASFDAGSTIAPMPFGRGGTGKAVWFDGEFYVFGGETLTGLGAKPGNVYDRVDVYNPSTNTWRTETVMPTPRHGVFPILYQGRVYVAGGGVVAGFSLVERARGLPQALSSAARRARGLGARPAAGRTLVRPAGVPAPAAR